MKAVLLCGSVRKESTTRFALEVVMETLQQQQIDCEMVSLANEAVFGCAGCGACRRIGKCVHEDLVNVLAEKLADAQAFIVGSPVYYASPNGALLCVLDRLFYSAGAKMAGKVGASVVVARRSGTTAAFDVLNKYFSISHMTIATSQYWNNLHGNAPQEARRDLEGIETLKGLALHVAYLLRAQACAAREGIRMPAYPRTQKTNFIR